MEPSREACFIALALINYLIALGQSMAVVVYHSRDSSLQATDLSPRQFLESQPDGAYTVMRVQDQSVWGREFHLHRLQESYSLLYGLDSDTLPAVLETNEMLDTLLQQQASPDTVCALTVLWYQTPVDQIFVCGHLCETSAYHPTPVSNVQISTTEFPNRLRLPKAKLSSWCRERKPLENDGNYQEVLLLDEQQNLLEGLTSTLFIVRNDGSLQTASTNVLEGYVRQRILDRFHAETTNIDLNFDNVSEVFLTSSIRLVIPVATVSFRGKTIWKYHPLPGNPVWKQVYETLLRENNEQS